LKGLSPVRRGDDVLTWKRVSRFLPYDDDNKPDGADVFPPVENTALNGGCDKEGAYLAQLNYYDLSDSETLENLSQALGEILDSKDIWEELEEDEEDPDDD
jgi:hypothetical protein